MRSAILLALSFSATAAAAPAPAPDVRLPPDAGALDLQKDFGAKSDKKTDDTQALQSAVDDYNRGNEGAVPFVCEEGALSVVAGLAGAKGPFVQETRGGQTKPLDRWPLLFFSPPSDMK